MKPEKQKSLAMILTSAAILAALNAGVWLAAEHEMIAVIGNHFLWTVFAVLNVVSLIWAISLLGLQPLVVAISYVAGGFLAFKGVQGISGVHVAELTTAGATYAAFGSIVVGNTTARVRLAYYNKKQIPFIFIIAALLVFSAVLSSELPGSDRNTIINAVVFPFVLSGLMVGFVWAVVSRYSPGKKAVKIPAVMVEERPEAAEKIEEIEPPNTLQMPIDALEEEEEEDEHADAVLMEDVESPEIADVPVEEPVSPVVAAEEKIEEFFPLEIDKGDDFVQTEEKPLDVAQMVAELEEMDEEPYSLPAFNTSLYDTNEEEVIPDKSLEEEPAVSLSLNLNALETVGEQPEKAPVAEVQLPDPEPSKGAKPVDPVLLNINALETAGTQPEKAPVAEVPLPDPEPSESAKPVDPVLLNLNALETAAEQPEKAPVAEVQLPEPKPSKSAKPADWLSGHLDLLNKLK